MPNDLSTLNGSLVEMKDQLIYELGQKGVSASYDSTTGLLGLIGKISEIQTGGSCYHIEFSNDSYIAVGGSVTLECTLQQNYAPLPNVTVTLSDGSSQYSSITNSNGIATFNLSNLSATATWTCSYSNVSDTCTVTIASYLFYDACDSADGLSSYGNGLSLRNNATTRLSYDSTMNAYKVTNSAQGCGMIPITILNGKNNFKFEFDLYSNNSDKGLGFAMKNTSSNDFHYLGFSCYLGRNVFWSNNNETETIFGNTIAKTTWHHIIITVTSSTITYDIDNGSQTGSFSTYISMDNNVVIGIESQWVSGDSGYVKNIIVEPI